MYRLVTLFVLNPIIIFLTFLVINQFIFHFYGCSSGCVQNLPIEIFEFGEKLLIAIIITLPFSLFVILPLLIISIRNHSLRFSISKQIKIALLTGSSLIPLPGIIFVINRANQHPYYWDVVQKGSGVSYLSFISGDILWYACVYLVFLLAVYFLIKLYEKRFS